MNEDINCDENQIKSRIYAKIVSEIEKVVVFFEILVYYFYDTRFLRFFLKKELFLT